MLNKSYTSSTYSQTTLSPSDQKLRRIVPSWYLDVGTLLVHFEQIRFPSFLQKIFSLARDENIP